MNKKRLIFIYLKISMVDFLDDLDVLLEMFRTLKGDNRTKIKTAAIGMGLWKKSQCDVLETMLNWKNKIETIGLEMII